MIPVDGIYHYRTRHGGKTGDDIEMCQISEAFIEDDLEPTRGILDR
jgi:hypothetical protein